MEQITPSPDMLDLLTQPAFYVNNGKITRVNAAAAQLQIVPDTPISELLLTGSDEYAAFQAGELYLTLKSENTPRGACVTRIDTRDVFLLEQQEELAELHAMSLAAQELRNPLSTVLTAAGRLSSALPGEAEKDIPAPLAHLKQGIYQMHRLVNNMSAAARYSKKNPVYTETCNIRTFFDELFDYASGYTAQSNRILHCGRLDKDVFCLINKELMERAFYNLLSNAVKFSPADSVISVSISKNKSMLYLTVENIPDGYVGGNFFTGFLREPGIADGRCGIGLGMVIVRSAATSHGGTVLAEQSVSATRVTLSFRITQSASGTLSSHIQRVDYAGEQNHGLIELSDILPAEAYWDT